MAAKSTLLNMVLCLSAVCLICSALLAGTYAMTKEPIDAAQVEKTNKTIAMVLPAFEGDAVASSIEVNGVSYNYYQAPGAGYAIISQVSGFGGPLSVMVGVNSEGIVHNTKVLSHSETPGLGAKCQTDAKFLGQFQNWDPASKKLSVKKDGGDVDAITASTITSRAYTLAIANAVEVYNKIVEGGQTNE